MSASYHSITVVLADDVSEEYATDLCKLFRLMGHVVSATPNVSGGDAHMAEQRARAEIGGQVLEILYPKTRK